MTFFDIYLAALAGCLTAIWFLVGLTYIFTERARKKAHKQQQERSVEDQVGVPLVDDSAAKREWDKIQAEIEEEGTFEEPFGVDTFTPIEPTLFIPGEWMEIPRCSTCNRQPYPDEWIYEVPVPESGGVKILCSTHGKVPT